MAPGDTVEVDKSTNQYSDGNNNTCCDLCYASDREIFQKDTCAKCCDECWVEWFKYCINKGGEDLIIPCPRKYCGEVIHDGCITEVLLRNAAQNEQLLHDWNILTARAAGQVAWCPVPKCGFLNLHNPQVDGSIYTCQKCHNLFCRKCHSIGTPQMVHPICSAPRYARMDNLSKKCPTCGIQGHSSDLGDHLQCDVCRAIYCSFCLKHHRSQPTVNLRQYPVRCHRFVPELKYSIPGFSCHRCLLSPTSVLVVGLLMFPLLWPFLVVAMGIATVFRCFNMARSSSSLYYNACASIVFGLMISLITLPLALVIMVVSAFTLPISIYVGIPASIYLKDAKFVGDIFADLLFSFYMLNAWIDVTPE